MTKKPMPTTRTELLADLDAHLSALRIAKASEPFKELGRYVVMSASHLPLRFAVSASGDITDAQLAQVNTATRFNRATAYHVAQAVRDGRGALGEAMTLAEAYDTVISRTQDTRDTIAKFEEQQ